MKKITDCITKKQNSNPEKILQFGEGNFLRAFADWMIDCANKSGEYEGDIVICQPIENGLKEQINNQNGIYTIAMRGLENGKAEEKFHQVTSVSRCINPYEEFESLLKIARSSDLEVIISNTTEAGICYQKGMSADDTPPASFPAKVTVFLYERFKYFNGDINKGLLFLPVELIDNNGDELKKIIIQHATEWNLNSDFIDWITNANVFANTLVDRIVTGYPKDQLDYFTNKLGYTDNLITTCELFNLWVIEADDKNSNILPIHKTASNVIWTDDVKPYKKRKVRILNGGHTSTIMAAYLAGHDIVLELMEDNNFVNFLKKVLFDEVIPTIDLPKEELEAFANDVLDRFSNPYIKHSLLDISLNSCSKFSVRCLPSLLDYIEIYNKLPEALTFSLAALIQFYKPDKTAGENMGRRNDGTTYPIRDDQKVIEFFKNAWTANKISEVVKAILSNKNFWNGKDLCDVPNLEARVYSYLKSMQNKNISKIIEEIIS